MTYSLTWLPDILKAAGLTVQAVDGWQTRGHGDFGKPLGVLAHHTCGPKDGDIRDLHVLVDGRSDLAGPLCNLGLARSGVFWVVAAGKAWHAGAGNWQGVTDGNSHLIGIEAENVGDGHDPWPAAQMDAYKRGCAAILAHIGAEPIMVGAHKEYALPRGRKDDPDFDMAPFRADIAALMGIKPAAPVSAPTALPEQSAATLDDDGSVKWVQTQLNKAGADLAEDGDLGPATRDAIKTFQRVHDLTVDGIPGPMTRAALNLLG